jgi:two-component system nitrate/nitrite sensor histidine kinase NarX
MRNPRTLSTKLGAIGGAMLVLVLASIGLSLWVTWKLEGGAAAINEGGRMRMQAWRLVQALNDGPPAKVDAYLREFDAGVALLRAGDPARPLFVPGDEASQARLQEVAAQWTVLRQAWAGAGAPAAAASQAEAFVTRIDAFVGAIETQLARWTAVLHVFLFLMAALTIASAIALLFASYLFVFNPLAHLQQGLERVQSGDLSARVEVSSRDEFGALSAGFNRMTETLQGLYQTLEARVQEKTLRLEAEHVRLTALYEAAAFVTRAASLEELAQGFARQVRRVARADAAVVRWSDEANRRYVLLASDCLPQQMVDDEHCLNTGECLCGQPRTQAATRVIPIQPTGGSDVLGHCHRAGYQTVVAVPVRLQERLVGELGLFFRSPTTLADDDRVLLEALAAHLAGAIEGLRVGALEREAVVAEERGLLARELHDSIAQSLAFLKMQVAMLRDAAARADGRGVAAIVDELDAGVRESLSDVRELLLHFRTRTNAEDLEPALQATLRKFEHQTGLTAHLSVAGQGLPLPPDVQVQVLHVVQEALSNVRKHAQAREVWVEVQKSPAWRIEVRDDGRGFAEVGARAGETQVGLRIMRERAARIGAAVDVRSSPGAGTRVVIALPEPQRLAA